MLADLAPRIAALAAKGAAAHADTVALPGGAPVAPRWLGRRRYIAAVSQMLHGEILARDGARRLAVLLAASPAAAFVTTQVADEERHIALLTGYLGRLGDIAAIDAGLGAAGALMLDPALDAVRLAVALNVVLEGEAVAVHAAAPCWFPCPILGAASRRIERDEARHVAFGRLVLPALARSMPAAERVAVHHWAAGLWRTAASGRMGDSLPARVAARRRGGYMAARWCAHAATLAALGFPAAP